MFGEIFQLLHLWSCSELINTKTLHQIGEKFALKLKLNSKVGQKLEWHPISGNDMNHQCSGHCRCCVIRKWYCLCPVTEVVYDRQDVLILHAQMLI